MKPSTLMQASRASVGLSSGDAGSALIRATTRASASGSGACQRIAGRPIKPIIVSPPPYPGNPRLSEHYTRALEAIARDHHISFLDTEALLRQGAEDWQKAYFAAPDAEGILCPNPNEAAHRRIAEQLLKLIY